MGRMSSHSKLKLFKCQSTPYLRCTTLKSQKSVHLKMLKTNSIRQPLTLPRSNYKSISRRKTFRGKKKNSKMQPARTLKTAILTKARKRAITTRRSHVKVAGVKIRTSKNRANRTTKRRVDHWVRAKVVVEKITTIGAAEVSVVVRTTEVVVVEEPTLLPRSMLLMFRLKMIE